MLRLPTLTTDVDCAPIGYPGLIVRFWLNPPLGDYAPPWAGIEDDQKRAKAQEREPWLSEWFHGMGRNVIAVLVPGAYTETGQDEEITVGSGRDYYDLERRDDFDPAILNWAALQFASERNERLRIARKN